jgi:hypothetical protein
MHKFGLVRAAAINRWLSTANLELKTPRLSRLRFEVNKITLMMLLLLVSWFPSTDHRSAVAPHPSVNCFPNSSPNQAAQYHFLELNLRRCLVRVRSDWRFTVNQFVLATRPLRLTTSNFIFQLNTYDYSPYVTSSLTRS